MDMVVRGYLLRIIIMYKIIVFIIDWDRFLLRLGAEAHFIVFTHFRFRNSADFIYFYRVLVENFKNFTVETIYI